MPRSAALPFSHNCSRGRPCWHERPSDEQVSAPNQPFGLMFGKHDKPFGTVWTNPPYTLQSPCFRKRSGNKAAAQEKDTALGEMERGTKDEEEREYGRGHAERRCESQVVSDWCRPRGSNSRHRWHRRLRAQQLIQLIQLIQLHQHHRYHLWQHGWQRRFGHHALAWHRAFRERRRC